MAAAFSRRTRILKVMLAMEAKNSTDEEGAYSSGVRPGSVTGICSKLYGADCVLC